jgi:alpha-methylacyl-CoA racemase
MSLATELLSDVTVLDFSTQGPGPRCTRILADYGARLIKVRPTDAENRLLEPPAYSYSGDRGVERIKVNLKHPDGREVAREIATRADVVVESFRPGVARKLSIDYSCLSPARPGLVYCSVSGYGQDGPYATRPGHDLNYLGVSGYLSVAGRRDDGRPALPGATVADAAGGFAAATAVLAALTRSRSTGQGAYLDVSTVEAAVRLGANFLDEYLATGQAAAPRRHRLTGGLACYDVYRAGDGRFVTVAALERPFWLTLCQRLQLEEFADRQRDDAAQDRIRAALAERFAEQPAAYWATLLADCCVGPVHEIPEVFDDEQLDSRGITWQVPRRGGAPARQLAPALAGVADTPDPAHELRDRGETDCGTLLTEIGYPPDKQDELRRAGIVA